MHWYVQWLYIVFTGILLHIRASQLLILCHQNFLTPLKHMKKFKISNLMAFSNAKKLMIKLYVKNDRSMMASYLDYLCKMKMNVWKMTKVQKLRKQNSLKPESHLLFLNCFFTSEKIKVMRMSASDEGWVSLRAARLKQYRG